MNYHFLRPSAKYGIIKMKRLVLILCSLFLLVSFACSEYDDSGYGQYSREELRYYAYAPPQIPHQVLNKDCLDCHKNGLVVKGYTAKRTPHPHLVNCQQCHIRADESVELFRENTFAGIQEPDSYQLTQPKAPPLMPHPKFMREDCLVCHADSSRTEITQTTHPERLNCTQCHIEQDRDVTAFLAEE
jgi:cytochrome c-type protein NapB